MRTPLVAAGLLALLLAAPAVSAEPRAAPSDARAPAAEAARLYLGQSLAALGWALRYARQAGQLGPLEEFDLQKYVAELDLVARGIERYLHPEGPPPAPAAPVEITGQFLAEGLNRALAPPPPAPEAGETPQGAEAPERSESPGIPEAVPERPQ